MTVYAVDLLYNQIPTLDGTAIVSQIEQRTDALEAVGPSRQLDSLIFAHRPSTLERPTGSTHTPRLVVSLQHEPLPFETLRPALQQAWDWPDANVVVAAHQGVIRIADFHADELEPRTRLAVMHDAVEAMLAVAPCEAIHWRASQCVTSPHQYLAARTHEQDAIFPAVHVRHFAELESLGKETLSDTLGLAALGLPDLQCHYTGLDRADVAQLLQRIARVLFAQGNVLTDGDTVAGLPSGELWQCRRGLAHVGPVRDVIRLTPGAPFAAGRSM